MATPRADSYTIQSGVDLAAGRPPPSELSFAIAAMSANSLAEFTGTNINEMESSNWLGESLGILESASNSPVCNWPGKGGFDFASGKLCFVGTTNGYVSHTPAGTRSKAVVFELAANEFAVQWNPTGRNEGHVYDGNSGAALGGYFYRRGYASNVIWRALASTMVWEAWIDTTSFTGSAEQVVSLEVFPTLGAQGSIILLGGTGKLWRYDLATATGSLVGTYAGTATYAVCVYSPNADCVVFGGGGGGTKLYKLSNAGAVTEIAQTLPASVEVAADGDSGATCADPVNGRILTFSNPTNKLWALDISAGTWSELLTFPAGLTNNADNAVAISMPGLGGVALIAHGGRSGGVTTSKFWLYKA